MLAAHHISFPVADLGQSLRFYEGFLGLEQIPRPDFPMDGAWLQAGPVQVHLIAKTEGIDLGAPPPDLNPTAQHAAFAIDDFAATLQKAEEHGLEIMSLGPEAGQMWVRDPDGHIIELVVDKTVAERTARDRGLDS